jgi:hypothetical protein
VAQSLQHGRAAGTASDDDSVDLVGIREAPHALAMFDTQRTAG